MRPIAICAGAVLLLLPALAADPNGEIVTAAAHAKLAAAAADLEMVHMHLHHTVNCLVGPHGAGFDASQLNPCANAGGGAIPDAAPGQAAALKAALATAQAGIATGDIEIAKSDATDAAAQLTPGK